MDATPSVNTDLVEKSSDSASARAPKSAEHTFVSPLVKTALKSHIGGKRAREEGDSSLTPSPNSTLVRIGSESQPASATLRMPGALGVVSTSSSVEYVSALPATALPTMLGRGVGHAPMFAANGTGTSALNAPSGLAVPEHPPAPFGRSTSFGSSSESLASVSSAGDKGAVMQFIRKTSAADTSLPGSGGAVGPAFAGTGAAAAGSGLASNGAGLVSAPAGESAGAPAVSQKRALSPTAAPFEPSLQPPAKRPAVQSVTGGSPKAPVVEVSLDADPVEAPRVTSAALEAVEAPEAQQAPAETQQSPKQPPKSIDDHQADVEADYRRALYPGGVPELVAAAETLQKATAQQLELFAKRINMLPVPNTILPDGRVGNALNDWQALKRDAQLPPTTVLQHYVADCVLDGVVPVINDTRLVSTTAAGARPRALGAVTYSVSNGTSLPAFTADQRYCTLDVFIPSAALRAGANPAVAQGHAWGTDVYTDDSDPAAMVVHAGWVQPDDAPAEAWAPPKRRPFEQALIPRPGESAEADVALSRPADARPAGLSPPKVPFLRQSDFEPATTGVVATLRILPTLARYSGTTRYGVASRSWIKGHDGQSVAVVGVRVAPLKQRLRVGRKAIKAQRALSRDMRESLAVRLSPQKPAWFAGIGSCDQHGGFAALSWFSGAAAPVPLAEAAAAEGPEGRQGITCVFSDVDGALCAKYQSELLNYWPPFTGRQRPESVEGPAASLADPATRASVHAVLQYAEWPFWAVCLLRSALVLETPCGVRLELRADGGAPSFNAYSLYVRSSGKPTGAPVVLFRRLRREMIRFMPTRLALVNVDVTGAAVAAEANGKKRDRGVRVVRPEAAAMAEPALASERWCDAVPEGYLVRVAKFAWGATSAST